MGGKVGSRAKKAVDIRQLGTEHRLKIANSNVLNKLIAHVDGKEKLEATQVTAAIALVKKILPDLTYTESDNKHEIVGPRKIELVAGNRHSKD